MRAQLRETLENVLFKYVDDEDVIADVMDEFMMNLSDNGFFDDEDPLGADD
jgi:hypothetical protein